jgi:hypothetical protein
MSAPYRTDAHTIFGARCNDVIVDDVYAARPLRLNRYRARVAEPEQLTLETLIETMIMVLCSTFCTPSGFRENSFSMISPYVARWL